MADHLPFSRDKFFAELEPKLAKIANKCKVHDPFGEARSWFVKFAGIYDSINQNPHHAVFQNLERGGAEEDIAKIKSNVIAYMVTGFRPDLFRKDAFDKNVDKFIDLSAAGDLRPYQKNNEVVGQMPAPSRFRDQQEIMDNAIDQSRVCLDDLIALIKSDFDSLADPKNTRDAVSQLFIGAVLEHYQNLRRELGDIPVIRDLDAKKPKEFFVKEMLNGRISCIKKILTKKHSLEKREDVADKLFSLIDKRGAGNPSWRAGANRLRRKIIRYFSEQPGGLHFRLTRNL